MNNIYENISKEFRQLVHHSLKEIADNISYQKGSSSNKHIFKKNLNLITEGGKKVNLQSSENKLERYKDINRN